MLAQGAGRCPETKGELTFGKLADVITFRLRADACRFGIDQVDRFFRLRGWRTMRPWFQQVETMEPASCQSPLPEDEEGGPSPQFQQAETCWTSTLLHGVRTSAYLRLCSIGFGPTADGTSSITPIVC